MRAAIGRHVPREQEEGDSMELTNEQLVEMYRRMVRIRRFEENVIDMVASGEIPGAAHSSRRPSDLPWLHVREPSRVKRSRAVPSV